MNRNCVAIKFQCRVDCEIQRAFVIFEMTDPISKAGPNLLLGVVSSFPEMCTGSLTFTCVHSYAHNLGRMLTKLFH